MKKILQDNSTALIVTLTVFLLYILHALALDGSYRGGDVIRHYLVAGWSLKHPDLLLYHWGKPFFTLVTSVFSQFLLIEIKVFNTILGAFTSYLCFQIAKKLWYANSISVIVFTFLAPVYILFINSGLIEPMFTFVLILIIYLFLKYKYVAGAILWSFMPFIRSEGNLMFPLVLMVFLFHGKWFLTPWLTFGTVAYSILGYFHYHDIFRIKTKNPYTGSNFDIYGQGESLHYVNSNKLLMGLPQTILFLAGTIWMIIKIVKKPVINAKV